jgi:hypothetical protein
MKQFFLFLIIILASGCAMFEPLKEGEKPMPLLDFQNGQFFEIPQR